MRIPREGYTRLEVYYNKGSMLRQVMDSGLVLNARRSEARYGFWNFFAGEFRINIMPEQRNLYINKTYNVLLR